MKAILLALLLSTSASAQITPDGMPLVPWHGPLPTAPPSTAPGVPPTVHLSPPIAIGPYPWGGAPHIPYNPIPNPRCCTSQPQPYPVHSTGQW